MVVVDTSVALKWFFPEDGSERAKALLTEDILAAPDMLLYEITNVLHCKKQLTTDDVKQLVADFLDYDVQMFVIPSHKFSRVVDLSEEFDITTYDASFIAMAELLKTEMVTADIKLANKVKTLGYVHAL
jgi:predicted nucleic acid-binding protein